jgi:V/A-type H+-transporting ATPase subunit D
MAKIKHTKNELKSQREDLRRYERFLPMLQLKKQQLQMEILQIDGKMAQKKTEEDTLRASLHSWVKLFCQPFDLNGIVRVKEIHTSEGNIAGVVIPVLTDVVMERREYDLFMTAPWVDDAAEFVEKLARLHAELEILEEQRRRIVEELRTTSQRVNLFEKVKIPECREHIRVIKIFLGDQQTAGVVRGKISKRRTEQAAEEAA